MSSFNAFLFGFIVLTVGLAAGAAMLGAPPVWIGIGAIVLIGIGIMSAVTHTKRKDLPEAS